MFLKLDGDEYLVLLQIESVKYNKAYKQIEMKTAGSTYTVPIPKTKGTDWAACMDFLLKKIAEAHGGAPKIHIKIEPTRR